jgi:ATP-binding cassette subfamily F protein 3
MIHLQNVTLARGTRQLLADASLQVHPGWRVGVVGANGSGKSSLFALLRGELHADGGEVVLPAHWRVASVAQETPALARAALEHVLDGDAELRGLEGRLAAAEQAHDGNAIGELHAALAAIDGYGAAARAAALLDGLGFSQSDLARPVAEFSGGWRMRLNLAQALGSRADLLLLDEPTNHLDLDAIVWFERWLASWRGTLLLISHDRDLLDACTTHTAHVADAALALYGGNYSTFETERAGRLAMQQALHARQQRRIADIRRFVDRFRAQATKARQAQSRLKALDRMQLVAPAHVDAPFEFEFPAAPEPADPLLSLEDVAAGYAERTVLADVRLALRAGARVGLLGPNGAGKSTLMRLLAGDARPQGGRRVVGTGVRLGYFAQQQLEQLDPDDSPLGHFRRREPGTREQELRDYLGGFDFRGDQADAPVGRFSGGEKSRLALALLVRAAPNLLLLDEPTNHLDLEMRHALTRALAGYAGSLVLVSHDRALLRTVCDEFWLVADGRVRPFDGDLDDYVAWLEARRAARALAAVESPVADARAVRERQRLATEQARRDWLARRRPLLRESGDIERRMEQLHARLDATRTQLADPALYSGAAGERLRELTREDGALSQDLGRAEERWLEVQLALEALGPEPGASF